MGLLAAGAPAKVGVAHGWAGPGPRNCQSDVAAPFRRPRWPGGAYEPPR